MTAPLTNQPADTSLCPHPHGKKAKRCRACQLAYINSDPSVKARQRAGVLKHNADPMVREAKRKLLANHIANMSDEERERRRAHGKRIFRDVLNTPEVIAKLLSPETRKRAGEKRTATVLRDIPPYLRGDYKALVRSNNVNAAEARQIILAQYRRDIGVR